MNFLACVFSLTLGTMPLGVFPVWEDQRCVAESVLGGSLFTELSARVYFWNMIYVGGSIKSLMFPPQEPWTNASFDPFEVINFFEAGLEMPISPLITFNLRFGHWCKHPEITYLPTREVRNIWEGAYEELSVGLTVDTRKE